ncbi:gliding motility-associated peptidyl-prolyl isomerase GldI [Psychroserpens luteolus]|uniref:gliding motility-associated peptidyl-prolyl isomerase GldI n=1 Tax=Psychroserpens luteolus TaxID=2855840 RepID=UPI001E420512|nr:gliding motility-associated peptidyl-prolyl isomerase GldI [Psychroserpens luteolus]MCD2258724.1 gliding motility-associated peptidyl-prolyl isomerase GldI [Psychroserpens luteolus]
MKTIYPLLFLILLAMSCKTPEARQPKDVKSGSFIKESAERNKKLNEREQKRIEAIMAQNPEYDYVASANGFWYYYHTKVEIDTITASFGDIVNFDYDVKDLNGNVIYTKEELGTQNYAMDQEEIFQGLREGLKLMKPTESVTFLFPSQKAYGYYGDNNRIGTNIPLMCKVTVNTIKQNQ